MKKWALYIISDLRLLTSYLISTIPVGMVIWVLWWTLLRRTKVRERYLFYLDFIPSVNTYLEATKDYQRFENEGVDYDEDAEYNEDDYEEIDMEEEEPKKKKNQPDEDGWTIV